MNEEKLSRIWHMIMCKLYRECKPKTNFDNLVKRGITSKPEWFMHYYLPEERQVKIVDSYCNRYKLSDIDRGRIRFSVYLGCAPNSSEETWKRHRYARSAKK